MLPEGNEMMGSTYEAKKTMKKMGSGYTKLHACINDCVLNRYEYKDFKVCPRCGKSRWKVYDKTGKLYESVPAKVLWYFPIIPRMKRLFQTKTIAKDLIWHETSRKKDGVLRHPGDSQAWREIDHRFPEIVNDPRNLRLGISADGVDINRRNRHQSVWPVLTVIYNLPSWLCMKGKFIMLSLLISGVETYDAHTQEMFTLHAVVLWTINDYPALGTLYGCTYSGYKGRVVCRQKTQCVRLPFLGKQSYVGHRRTGTYKQGNGTILPTACYTLTKEEKDKFCETLYELRVPQGYCSNFASLSTYGASDKFFNELLVLLKKMLPEGNEMMGSTYVAKKTMKAMGSGYTKIHACINDRVLYRNEYKDFKVCPRCGKSRWKVDDKMGKLYESVPAKVLCRRKDGVLRHPADSQAWMEIDHRFPEIANDPRSLRLGISADGTEETDITANEYKDFKVCPRCGKSRWKVYDKTGKLYVSVPAKVLWYFPIIPRMKRLFQTKTIAKDLIWHETSRKKDGVLRHPGDSQAWREIDHRFPEIANDPRNLRLGISADGVDINRRNRHQRVETYDAHTQEMFTLHAVVLWTINDYPALGIFASFDGKWWQDEENQNRVKCGNKETTYWKKYKIWQRRLMYWRYSSLQHCIDFMHVEKNVCESLIGTLLHMPGKTKDGLEARMDLVHFALKPELERTNKATEQYSPQHVTH
ncbi:hypothetical protein OSB04_un000867 [Centaurea solstitialis]|uniref:Transposase n=1 Tax=Centaurea solstitialis TaxID=347529 RepID=A0AA38SGW8_9ASTR|nr:hypothetical protein OSB04_un000867 [Centaurea solstitialis]